MIFISVGLLIVVNITFVIYNFVLNCRNKKRNKRREARRVTWEAAWKEVEKKKPSRFVKPREYEKKKDVEENSVDQESDKKLANLQSLVQGPLPAI